MILAFCVANVVGVETKVEFVRKLVVVMLEPKDVDALTVVDNVLAVVLTDRVAAEVLDELGDKVELFVEGANEGIGVVEKLKTQLDWGTAIRV